MLKSNIEAIRRVSRRNGSVETVSRNFNVSPGSCVEVTTDVDCRSIQKHVVLDVDGFEISVLVFFFDEPDNPAG